MRYYKVTFIYKGKREEVILKAIDKAEALNDGKKLNKGILVKVEEVPMPMEEKIKLISDLVKAKLLRKKLNLPAYISAIRQLAVLLKAGISLKDSLEDIAANSKDSLIKEIFFKAAEAIDSGKSLSSVFAEFEPYVGGVSVAMIRLGEQTGDMVMALESLAKIYENMYENRRKMIKALRYPIITLIGIALAFVFLIVVVVPKFKNMFEQLHAKLPLPTRILLGIEDVFIKYGVLIAILLGGSVVLILFLYKTSQKFKYVSDEIILKTPIISRIIEYSTLHKFLTTMGSLLKSGIPLVEALEISEGIIENDVIRKKIERTKVGINQGRSFSEMLANENLLNFVALRMISAGEESGELDSMIQSASKYYEDRFQDIIDNIQASIEPLMLVIIGAMVLLLALGIFLPMWDMANAARNV